MARRVALLVATYRYQDAGLRRLTAPGHDAEELAKVLRDPNIGGFEVTILVNKPNHVVGRAIGEFYGDLRRDDLTFLYFTGHGLKDDHGDLYLAMTDTSRGNLLYTAVSAQHIDRSLDSCRSRQNVIVLDCCYSGAFPAGHIAKSDPEVHTLARFPGKGRVVLTASDATQYSFEGNKISGEGTRSLFTRYIVEGLATGDADLDSDGDISLHELYSYVYERVIEELPQQRPKKQENIEGSIVIARNAHWCLPTNIRRAAESPIEIYRLAALDDLARLHRTGNELVRAAVLNEVRILVEDNSRDVSVAAAEVIGILSPGEITRGSRSLDRWPAEAQEQSASPAVPTGSTAVAGNDWLGMNATNVTAESAVPRSHDIVAAQTRDAYQAFREWIRAHRMVTAARSNPWVIVLGVLFITIFIVIGGVTAWVRSQYFVGAAVDGEVGIFRGVPGEVLGLSLHTVAEGSCPDRVPKCEKIFLSDLRQFARVEVERGLVSNAGLERARDIIAGLRSENLLPVCPVPNSVPSPVGLPDRPSEPGVDCRTER